MLRAVGSRVGGGYPINGTVFTATTAFRGPNGSQTVPTFSYTNDIDTGAYLIGDGVYGITVAGTSRFSFSATEANFFGASSGGSVQVSNGGVFRLSSDGNPGDVVFARAAANSVVFGTTSAAAGSATSRTEMNKAVAAIANNTATTVFTVTIPNAAHSGSILVKLVGALGAGGAIGAKESTQSATYNIDITRTAGVNAVATIGAVIGQPAAASVAGAANAAVTATLGAVAGAVGVANTFTIQVTIDVVINIEALLVRHYDRLGNGHCAPRRPAYSISCQPITQRVPARVKDLRDFIGATVCDFAQNDRAMLCYYLGCAFQYLELGALDIDLDDVRGARVSEHGVQGHGYDRYGISDAASLRGAVAAQVTYRPTLFCDAERANTDGLGYSDRNHRNRGDVAVLGVSTTTQETDQPSISLKGDNSPGRAGTIRRSESEETHVCTNVPHNSAGLYVLVNGREK